MIPAPLSSAQDARVLYVAEVMQQCAEENGLRNAWGSKSREESLRKILIGLRGEYAFCLAYGIRWRPKKGVVKGRPDVVTDLLPFLGREIQIRTRSLESVRQGDVDLCLRPDDPANQSYVLIHTAEESELQIIGWCWGHEGQQAQFRHHSGRFYIKQKLLRSLNPPTWQQTLLDLSLG